jgi:WD40 repeat protein
MTTDRWGARGQIRARQTGVLAALVIAALIAWCPAGAAGDGPGTSVKSLFASKDKVARKVAEFTEGANFVVGGLDFNGDGTELVTNGQVAPPEVHIWSWRTASHIARVLPLPTSAGGGDAIGFNPAGTLLAVGHTLDLQRTLVRVWRTDTWAVVADNPERGGDVAGLAFSSDGTLFACAVFRPSPPNLIVHKTDTWEEAWGIGTEGVMPYALTLSPDGRYAAVGGVKSVLPNGNPPIIHHPRILIVDLSSRQIVRTIAAFPDHNEIHALAWSPDGKSLAAGGLVTETAPGPDAVRIFDPMTGQLVGTEAAKAAQVTGLRYSSDGRYLVDGDLDGEVHVWDGRHQQLLQAIPINQHFFAAVSISRDSRFLAIAAGRDVSVWQLQ